MYVTLLVYDYPTPSLVHYGVGPAANASRSWIRVDPSTMTKASWEDDADAHGDVPAGIARGCASLGCMNEEIGDAVRVWHHLASPSLKDTRCRKLESRVA